MNLHLATLLFVVLSQSAKGSVSVSFGSSVRDSQSVGSTNATCPYRTINYITHGLPQQCLTSSWRSTSSTPSTNIGESAFTAAPSLAEDAASESGSGSSTTIPASTRSLRESSSDAASTAASSGQSSEPWSASPIATPSDELEEPSPLEDDKFMSFEEWKKQNLQKAGQSDHLGRDKGEPQAQRKRLVNIHTDLDSLGDDAEIDLDFSGFIPDVPEFASASAVTESDGPQQVQPDTEAVNTPSVRSRRKDAGTTYKERFNYASFDCAANILKTNSEATSAGTVLGENKDSYMLNVCSANNKFLILELCDDILIDTIVLANFEFFSSIFRTFRVSVSDKYPVKIDKWKTIGTFEARNARDVQAFLVENPLIWTRYVRIEFLTHYGNEYYCPVSLVRVHGTTMLEEYKRDAESLMSGEDDETEIANAEGSDEDGLMPEAIAAPILEEKQEELSRQMEQEAPSLSSREEQSVSNIFAQPTPSGQSTSETTDTDTDTDTDESFGKSADIPVQSDLISSSGSPETCSPAVEAVNVTADTPGEIPISWVLNATASVTLQASYSTEAAVTTGEVNATDNILTTKHDSALAEASSLSQSPSRSKAATNATTTDRQKSSSASTQSHAAAPTMQESFFKSVQKRLQMLEANSSLSLQYIEDQSRALRDAFNKVEQRQLAKTTTFLEYLNTTVLSELRDFRQQYDQLWQSTVIELEMQRERYQQEHAAINARLGVLADELIFQKRISILQMILILICLAIVLFARGTLNQYLEMPVVQRVLARSPSNRWLNFTNLDTPTQSPPVTRQSSLLKRQGILKGHRRMHSEDSMEGSLSPNDVYPSPPTPTSMSYGEQSDNEVAGDEKAPLLEDPEFDPATIDRPSTSPPILPSEMTSPPDLNGLGGSETIDSRLDIGLSSPRRNPEVHQDPLIHLPRLVVEEATPERHSKHLTWNLPGT